MSVVTAIQRQQSLLKAGVIPMAAWISHRATPRCFVLLTVLASLTGCGVAGAEFRNNLSSWTGQREITLVSAWGAPDRLYEVEGTRFLTYASSRTTVSSAPTYKTKERKNKTLGSFLVGLIETERPTVTTWTCTITFIVVGGIVQSSRYDGNDCHSNF